MAFHVWGSLYLDTEFDVDLLLVLGFAAIAVEIAVVAEAAVEAETWTENR